MLRYHVAVMVRPEDLQAADFPVKRRPPGEYSEVEPLLALCTKGKLYEVERWIDAGKPIQYSPPLDRKLQRKDTPLMIAVRRGVSQPRRAAAGERLRSQWRLLRVHQPRRLGQRS
ncbi:MAG: hypothetical protein WCQ89_09125 [Verrucomicrobiota bacterium]